ncbi:MAG: malate dehydrogenase [Candidatus Staskawiczbacteria bacterium RIFOXYB2_FULL_32_9]|uniref:Malate dehydrogenase n=1 Tax=Candidatus Staskawiczbacteria bacterium RIFOXYD1_FULL_32_13 TaxID=1802234 RepID=A0A1G2JLY6_9BACT|nr:MAG: Malate dehydrogenase [Parcubacteria group bacterium GW2011_GWC2_32_10]OGZ77908.1 MAG: malate dehydrogenase [Candidatus Staskawiczbacteria bacterium RIFOXYB1_FULL_32_11]OGZ84170.1 MAG: malate dehydrogenase [Candidatus Staskawiczbacteria bacterium RIFOXYB2_FULL_32_9]OGZ87775.1 MAG: malate dehydrogenase [Candidatus Staskawiczbacteria bacterium RIFOXYC2_FULL_32_10]OGZ88124.1 MAG: malate dehydrogenase [Candidatus Staskawiczbacteria bacterium RIFOXYD1_FULL_32_13]
MNKNNSLAKKALDYHKKLNGKIGVFSKAPLKSPDDLKLCYTPGVGAVSSYLATHKNKVSEYTIKKNAVAVISDGSAVLGLGNIGVEGALPVMEGKAMIFKEFANIDAFPIVLDTQDVEEIIKTIKHIAPVFGAINLEDISAPRCFEIERRLQDMLDIFILHDDQHATAIVVLAGLINAFLVAKKDLKKSSIVIIGAGSAGTAVTKLLHAYGVRNIIVVDKDGILSKCRGVLLPYQKELAEISNKNCKEGLLQDALIGADAAVGLSAPNIIKPEYIKTMNNKPIIFALANPVPEIMPDIAKKAGAFIVATGRSDFKNQVNNALVFPGIFRGALDNKVKKITDKMQISVSLRLAEIVKHPSINRIIPSIFDANVVKIISQSFKK